MTATFHAPLETQQFGVSLQFLKERNNGDVIPPVLKQCVDFLSQPEGIARSNTFKSRLSISSSGL